MNWIIRPVDLLFMPHDVRNQLQNACHVTALDQSQRPVRTLLI